MTGMHTLAGRQSKPIATVRHGGHAQTAQMVARTPGRHRLITEAEAAGVRSARANRSASTTAWPPRHLRLYTTGITRRTCHCHQTMSQQEVIVEWTGSAQLASMSGRQQLQGRCKLTLAAQYAAERVPRDMPSSQPLLMPTTICCLSGITC